MKLHSIYFVRDKAAEAAIPARIALNLDSLKLHYPGGVHHLYHLAEAEAFVAQHFDPETLAAFRTLQPLAYKADLFRYCLMWREGGLYSDLALMHFSALSLPQRIRFACFRDMSNNSPFICSNSLLYSHPGEAIWTTCIDAIKRHVAERYYGSNPLYPTGPVLFGRVVAGYFQDKTMLCGDTISTNGRDPYATYVFRDPRGEPVAVKHKPGDGLGHFGAPQDSYNKAWTQKQVYGEPLSWGRSGLDLVQRGLNLTRGSGA